MAVHVSFTTQEANLILEAVNRMRKDTKLPDKHKKELLEIKDKLHVSSGRKRK